MTPDPDPASEPVPDVTGAPRFQPVGGRWRPTRTYFGEWRAAAPGEIDGSLYGHRSAAQERCDHLNQQELDQHG